jgi:hypothetical protein
MTQQIYAIAVDFVHGDGLRDSARIKLITRESAYLYYFIDEFNKSSTFKELYFQGMSKSIRDSWERIKGVGIESIAFVELQELVRWSNNTYVKKMNKKRTPDVSTKHGSVNVHFEDNSSDEEEDKTETYTKRTKDDKNPSTSITDKVLNALVQNSESVNKLCSINVDCVNKMCASNSDSINRMCASNNSNMDKMFSMMEKHRDTVESSSSSDSFPDGLFAISQRQTRSNPYDGINSMYNTTENLFVTESPADSIFALPHRQPQPPTRRMMTTTSSCWICGQISHFAPKCPYISRIELFIITYNQLYKTNMNGYKTTPGFKEMKFEEACTKWGIPLPTDEEKLQMEKIYEPLKSKTPRYKNKGMNEKAYCHFCHANGHYLRDCKSQCIYCFQKGHNWKNCTENKYQEIIKARIALLPQTGGTVASSIQGRIFSLLQMEDGAPVCSF